MAQVDFPTTFSIPKQYNTTPCDINITIPFAEGELKHNTLSRREIRILDLFPGTVDDVVQCAIRVVNLDDEIEYTALSYVWGDRSGEKDIYIAGRCVRVTSNLYAALRRLRYLQGQRALWIDQLCINQSDNEERANQVALMQEIYTKCSWCMIWLGELHEATDGFSEEDAKAVFDFIRFAADLDEDSKIRELPILFRDSYEGNCARRAFEAFSMYGNPWWSRIWTIQEAITPKLALLIWGPFSLSREIVYRALFNLRGDLLRSTFSLEFCACRIYYTPLLRRLMYPVRGFLHCRDGEDSLDLLMRWRHRDSTDPRDKVYGLRGLVSLKSVPSAIHCSYDIPVSTLFEKITIDLVKGDNGLRALLGSTEMPHITPNLATWAIDFACSNRVGKRQLKWWTHSHRYKEFKACGNTTLDLVVSNDNRMLAISGTPIDDILLVSEVYKVLDTESVLGRAVRRAVEDARELLTQFKAEYKMPSTYFNAQPWDTAFWQTMVGNLIMQEFPVQRVEKHHNEVLDTLLDSLAKETVRELSYDSIRDMIPDHQIPEPGTYHEGDLSQLLERLSNQEPNNILYESICGMVPNHAFFITKSGFIGIGPPDAKPGDQVWVLSGGQVPFVLRKADADAIYSLVGDAYVHGIMDGEAVSDTREMQTAWIC